MDFLIPPKFWWSTDILLIINPSTWMDQEIHACGQGRIASVKINPFLPMMRDYTILKILSVWHLLRGGKQGIFYSQAADGRF